MWGSMLAKTTLVQSSISSMAGTGKKEVNKERFFLKKKKKLLCFRIAREEIKQSIIDLLFFLINNPRLLSVPVKRSPYSKHMCICLSWLLIRFLISTFHSFPFLQEFCKVNKGYYLHI